VIDPARRWGPSGEKPDFAGLLTYGGAPYSEDPKDLERADIAIVGAPMDDLVSDRPGARFGPRAIRAAGCPPGPHLEAKLDAFSELRIVDYGDAPVVPADPRQSHQAIQSIIDEVAEAGAIPIVLGGDHSITEPEITALARHHGPLGLVHFDTHTDTGATVLGAELSHGTPMYKLVENGLVDASRYVQIGLRGYWPGETEFGWQSSHGITSLFMHEIRELGIAAVVERAAGIAAGAESDQPVFLSIDVDVLDPAFAPGTGTPEPGGMTSAELLWAVRGVSERCRLVGGDVVEVAPTSIGGADVTALIADRVVREALTGIALRRKAVSESAASAS
jgi:agmatinase